LSYGGHNLQDTRPEVLDLGQTASRSFDAD
jgi:hypothetical protein